MATGFLRARPASAFGTAPAPAQPALTAMQQDAIRLEAARNGRKPVLLGGGGPARQRPILSGNQ